MLLLQATRLAAAIAELYPLGRMQKRRALMAGVFVALLFIGCAALHLVRKKDQTQAHCDAFMKRFSPPFPHFHTAFTPFLNNHPTAGEWVGFKPGWRIEYKTLGPGSGVTYYVDLSGTIVHSEPVNWMGALDSWKRAETNMIK